MTALIPVWQVTALIHVAVGSEPLEFAAIQNCLFRAGISICVAAVGVYIPDPFDETGNEAVVGFAVCCNQLLFISLHIIR